MAPLPKKQRTVESDDAVGPYRTVEGAAMPRFRFPRPDVQNCRSEIDRAWSALRDIAAGARVGLKAPSREPR